MKKNYCTNIWLLFLLFIPQHLLAQVWEVNFDVPEGRNMVYSECFSADNGNAMFIVGRTALSSDYTRSVKGVVAKVDAEGNYAMREIQSEGLELKYLCGTQLGNGNFIVFGLCDDSLHADGYQRFLRADVFDGDLNLLYTNVYRTDVGGYGGIYGDDIFRNDDLWCSKNDDGNVVLGISPASYVST